MQCSLPNIQKKADSVRKRVPKKSLMSGLKLGAVVLAPLDDVLIAQSRFMEEI